MPVKSLKKIPTYVWIPPSYAPIFKVEITRLDGTTDDVTSIIYDGSLTDGVTEIGNFDFTIDNSNQDYSGVWSGNEIIKIYMDYDTTATTLRFRGRIEQVSYQDYQIRVKGRAEGKKLLEVTVTKLYSNTETSEILTDLIETYTDFTTSNIDVSTKTITANWYQKPLFDCIQELCNASGFDCYVDHDLDVHYFESGTLNNTTEGIVHNQNLFNVGTFAYDYAQIKNRVIVYGGKIEDMDIIATSDDTTSQTNYGVKELIVNDQNITSDTQAQERADYELSISKNPPLTGDIDSLGLPTLQPGERIYISAPMSNLNPTYYKIVKYTHKFQGYLTTTVTVEKEPKRIYHLIKESIGQQQNIYDMPNPNEMRHTWIETFSTDSGVHTNTKIENGILSTDGSSTGIWISDIKSIDSNASSVELRASGDSLSGTQYQISPDGGISYQNINGLNAKVTLAPGGNNLRIKILFNSESTQIKSINLLYK